MLLTFKMVFKDCFVPSCGNNTDIAPNKLFIIVPGKWERRKQWFNAVEFLDRKRLYSHRLYCCEDHFNLENDAENWLYFKTMGKKLKLKPHVMPNKNITPRQGTENMSQLSDSARKRKAEALSVVNQLKSGPQSGQSNYDFLHLQTAEQSPSETSTELKVSNMTLTEHGDSQCKKRKFISTGIQVNFKNNLRSVGINTEDIKMVSRASSPCFDD